MNKPRSSLQQCRERACRQRRAEAVIVQRQAYFSSVVLECWPKCSPSAHVHTARARDFRWCTLSSGTAALTVEIPTAVASFAAVRPKTGRSDVKARTPDKKTSRHDWHHPRAVHPPASTPYPVPHRYIRRWRVGIAVTACQTPGLRARF